MLFQSVYPHCLFLKMSFMNVNIRSERSLTETSLSPSTILLEELFFAIYVLGEMEQLGFPDCAIDLEEQVTVLPFSSILWILEGWTEVFSGDEVSFSSSSKEFEIKGFRFLLSFYFIMSLQQENALAIFLKKNVLCKCVFILFNNLFKKFQIKIEYPYHFCRKVKCKIEWMSKCFISEVVFVFIKRC